MGETELPPVGSSLPDQGDTVCALGDSQSDGRRAHIPVTGKTGPFPMTASLLRGRKGLRWCLEGELPPFLPGSVPQQPHRAQPGLPHSQRRVPKPRCQGAEVGHGKLGLEGHRTHSLSSQTLKGQAPFTAEPLFTLRCPLKHPLILSVHPSEPLTARSPPGCSVCIHQGSLPGECRPSRPSRSALPSGAESLLRVAAVPRFSCVPVMVGWLHLQ